MAASRKEMKKSKMTELWIELEWRRCRDDIIYFAENYCYIKHPAEGAILIPLRDVQRTILKAWSTDRLSLSLKARQIGWTTVVSIKALHETLFFDSRTVIALSRRQEEARDLLSKSVYVYNRLPDWLKERGPERTNKSVDSFKLDNDSSIDSMPSRVDPARGRSASLVIIDEWAFFENPEDAWASVEPVADIGGRVIALSTAKGYGNFFHQFWQEAVSGVNGFRPLFFPWSSVPERGQDWYEAKKRALPAWQLAQEYPTDEDDCFVQSGNPVFSIPHIREMEGIDGTPGSLSDGLDGPQFLQGQGNLRIFRHPHPECRYVIGADISEGLEVGDKSAADVLDIATGEQVAFYHGVVDPDLFGHDLYRLGRYFNNALLAPESNTIGMVTVKALQRLRYPRLFFQRTVGSRRASRTEKVGWRTSSVTKPVMIEELAAAIRDEAIEIHAKQTILELLSYQRSENGRTEGFPHDDAVMSLAIAHQMLQYAHTVPEMVQEQSRAGTWDEWSKMLTKLGDGGTIQERLHGKH
jgi:hypothetical protein